MSKKLVVSDEFFGRLMINKRIASFLTEEEVRRAIEAITNYSFCYFRLPDGLSKKIKLAKLKCFEFPYSKKNKWHGDVKYWNNYNIEPDTHGGGTIAQFSSGEYNIIESSQCSVLDMFSYAKGREEVISKFVVDYNEYGDN